MIWIHAFEILCYALSVVLKLFLSETIAGFVL